MESIFLVSISCYYLQVVCRQLRFNPVGAIAFSYAHFGQGAGPIVLDNVQCTGLESHLTDCPNRGLLVNDCSHYEDAGVQCQGRCYNWWEKSNYIF